MPKDGKKQFLECERILKIKFYLKKNEKKKKTRKTKQILVKILIIFWNILVFEKKQQPLSLTVIKKKPF